MILPNGQLGMIPYVRLTKLFSQLKCFRYCENVLNDTVTHSRLLA